jgi:hypothetical protein
VEKPVIIIAGAHFAGLKGTKLAGRLKFEKLIRSIAKANHRGLPRVTLFTLSPLQRALIELYSRRKGVLFSTQVNPWAPQSGPESDS